MPKPMPPVAERRQHAATFHGITRQDPYHWLRADNWQEVMQQPETLPARYPSLSRRREHAILPTRSRRRTRLCAMPSTAKSAAASKRTTVGIPSPDGPFAYNSRMLEGQAISADRAHAARWRRRDGAARLQYRSRRRLFRLWWRAITTRATASRLGALTGRARNSTPCSSATSTAARTPARRSKTRPVVAPGRPTARPSTTPNIDDNHRPFRVRRHIMGTPQADDTIVFEETDPGFFVGVGKTLTGRFIVIDAHDHQTSEVWLIDAMAGGAPRLVAPRVSRARIRCRRARWRSLHPHQCRRGRGLQDRHRLGRHTAGAEHWADLVPHQPGRADPRCRRDPEPHAAARARSRACRASSCAICAPAEESTVDFDEEAYSLGMSAGYEFDTATIRFTYSSPTTPAAYLRPRSRHRRARTLLKEQEVPSGHDPADYETRRIFADAADGERVPVTLLYRKGTQARRLGPRPALWLWRLWHLDAGRVFDLGAVAGRSRLRLCHRPYPRRHGQGLSLVSARPARAQAQHLHRLHRGSREADRRTAIPRRARSSPRAARPAAC